MELSAEQFLREKLESEISSFGDGTNEFHTREIQHLLQCLDEKDNKIKEIENNINKIENNIINNKGSKNTSIINDINKDIVTITFKVNSELAANDLVTWFERGYDFVLDASVSEGEIKPGKYLVFVEMDRRSKVPERIISVLADLETLTGLKLNDLIVTPLCGVTFKRIPSIALSYPNALSSYTLKRVPAPNCS